ncbi:hypothetical protein LEMLEM_LOCUS5866, partial [Lemmus lemmus]
GRGETRSNSSCLHILSKSNNGCLHAGGGDQQASLRCRGPQTEQKKAGTRGSTRQQ